MSDSPQRDDERQPLDRIKPPREWRSRARPPLERRRTQGGAPARSTPAAAVGPRPPVRPVPSLPVISSEVHAPPAKAPSQTQASVVPSAVPDAPYESGPLPTRYNEDRVTLFVRDPHWCFAWWELTSVSRARLAVPPDRAPVLRFYDVTRLVWDGRNHHEARDIVVHTDVGDWYVELGRPGASFIAELGLRDDGGRFVAVARSNRVDMPRAGPSPDVDPAWPPIADDPRLHLSEEALATLDSSAGFSSGGGSGAAHPRPERDEST